MTVLLYGIYTAICLSCFYLSSEERTKRAAIISTLFMGHSIALYFYAQSKTFSFIFPNYAMSFYAFINFLMAYFLYRAKAPLSLLSICSVGVFLHAWGIFMAHGFLPESYSVYNSGIFLANLTYIIATVALTDGFIRGVHRITYLCGRVFNSLLGRTQGAYLMWSPSSHGVKEIK